MAGCTRRQTKACDATQSRPNVVFIYTDDQAPWALGASGNPQAFTPNMDRLVREGAYLTNSFTTTPVCSPSRVSLITSRYGSENGILDFIPQIGHRLYKPGLGIAPDARTFPELLSQAGYTTGLIGKWHLGEMDAVHPTRMGYDEFMGFRGGGISPVNPVLEEDGVEQEFKGLTCDILTDRAIGFLQRHQKAPFMLSVHYRAPHKQWLPVSEEDWAPYETMQAELPNPDYPDLNIPKMERWMREYLASVSGVDRNLGRILDTLDSLNLSQNTVVIFSSDHGYNMGHNGIWHKGNGMWATHEKSWPPDSENIRGKYRPNLYDNSLLAPTMVRWPGTIEPGTVVPQTTSNLDWFPTILAMCGVEPPKDTVIRGKSIVPLLRGEPVDWDNEFYAEYSMRCYCRTDMRMVRTPEWKLIRDFLNPGRDELYDLRNDPAETTNLIGDPRPETKAAIRKLDKKILEKMRDIQDPALKLVGR